MGFPQRENRQVRSTLPHKTKPSQYLLSHIESNRVPTCFLNSFYTTAILQIVNEAKYHKVREVIFGTVCLLKAGLHKTYPTDFLETLRKGETWAKCTLVTF